MASKRNGNGNTTSRKISILALCQPIVSDSENKKWPTRLLKLTGLAPSKTICRRPFSVTNVGENRKIKTGEYNAKAKTIAKKKMGLCIYKTDKIRAVHYFP